MVCMLDLNCSVGLVNQLDTSDIVVVNNGQFQIYIENGLPKVYYPQNTELPLNINPNKDNSTLDTLSESYYLNLIIIHFISQV